MSAPKLISSDRELIDFGAQMLTGWWRLTMQALLDSVGSAKTMEIITPNIRAHSRAIVLNNRERLEKLGYRDCPDWILSNLNYQFQHLVLRRTFNDIEITAKGGKGGEITSCPFQHDSVDICMILCDMMAGYVVSAFNPDLEYVPILKLTAGDPFCQAILSYKGKSLYDEGETIAVVRRLNIPVEMLDYYLFAWMGEMWAMMSNSAVEFFGEGETLELLRPYMKQNGMATALQLKERLRLDGNNAQTIGEIIDYCNAAVQQKGRILVSSPNHFEKEITECPFYGMSHTICSGLLTARSNGICNAINPEYGFFSNQRMCKGDKVCHWVVKKR
jgi:hypothetical protein